MINKVKVKVKVKVKAIYFKNGNNTIKNQIVIKINEDLYFQSYETMIVEKVNDKLYLDVNFLDFSNTTKKYLYRFLREFCHLNVNNKKDLIKCLEDNTIAMKNLN